VSFLFNQNVILSKFVPTILKLLKRNEQNILLLETMLKQGLDLDFSANTEQLILDSFGEIYASNYF